MRVRGCAFEAVRSRLEAARQGRAFEAARSRLRVRGCARGLPEMLAGRLGSCLLLLGRAA